MTFDLVEHLERQRKFSENTFGPGERAAGIIAHIKKELDEIGENTLDLEEWIDVVILAFDGAWRSGYTSDQITDMLRKKQVKNELRLWPDWRKAKLGEPIEHIRQAKESE